MIKWTKEKCHEEALKYKHKKDFTGSVAFNVSIKNDWYKEISSHLIGQKKIKGYWTKEKCHEEALKYNYRYDFRLYSCGAYTYAQKNRFLNDICIHMQKRKVKK